MRLGWTLALPTSEREKEFWWELNQRLLMPLDVIKFLLTFLSGLFRPRVPEQYLPWAIICAGLDMVMILWCLVFRRHYIEHRTKMVQAIRLWQVVATFGIARNLRSQDALQSFGRALCGDDARDRAWTYHMAASGTVMLFQTCFTSALPFLQSAALQLVSVAAGLIYVIPAASMVLASREYSMLNMQLYNFIDSLVWQTLSFLCATSSVLGPDPGEDPVISSRQAALSTLTFVHLFVGLVSPLYVVYEVEKVCKMRYMKNIQLKEGIDPPGRTGRTHIWSSVRCAACLARHLLVLTTMMAATWTAVTLILWLWY